MTQQVWLPSHGELLKKLREDAGVEITTLARTHSLSTTHIKQLEEGGDSCFYTPVIKLAVGRKLLAHFGVDLAELKPTTEAVAPQEHEVSDAITKATVKESKIDNQKSAVDEKKLFLNFRILLPSAALIFLGFAFINVYLTKKETASPITLNPVSPITTPPIPATVIQAPPSVETVPVAIPTGPVQATHDNASGCQWTKESTGLVGHQPSKIGDYVHFVAKADGTICAKDSTGKLQVLQLKNAQSLTVRGRPPFEIFSQNLHQFQIFYQGNLLKLPNESVRNISLKEQKYD